MRVYSSIPMLQYSFNSYTGTLKDGMMYDTGKIVTGLVVFAALFTSPFWYNLSNGKALKRPDIVLPTAPNEQQCCADSEYMRCDHMVMLDEWRFAVVRDGQTYYTSSTGRKFEMRFTKTCLGCHPNTSQFCDQCHNYIGVNLYCWDCHNKPNTGSEGSRVAQILNPEPENQDGASRSPVFLHRTIRRDRIK